MLARLLEGSRPTPPHKIQTQWSIMKNYRLLACELTTLLLNQSGTYFQERVYNEILPKRVKSSVPVEKCGRNGGGLNYV